jgi:signal transduction histidine kinase
LKIAIEMLTRSPSGNNAALLAECSDILEKSITETRTLSHLLHPPLLDEAGFASAASWFVSGFSQRSGIQVSLDIPPDLSRLPPPVEIALFRVLQESLTNVHRHSRATSAEIKVDADAEQITMEKAAGTWEWVLLECASAFTNWMECLKSRQVQMEPRSGRLCR